MAQKNWFNEVKTFENLNVMNRLSAGQQILWYKLMYLNNSLAWKTWFTVPISTLSIMTGLSAKAVYNARDALKKLGYIDFKSRGEQSSLYTIKNLSYKITDPTTEGTTDPTTEGTTDPTTEGTTDPTTEGTTVLNIQDNTIQYKTNNITPLSPKSKSHKKPKKHNPEKTHFADYVTFTQEEYNNLLEKFGKQGLDDRIENLNFYKGSHGKHYASDYMTILNWERKNNPGGNQNERNNGYAERDPNHDENGNFISSTTTGFKSPEW